MIFFDLLFSEKWLDHKSAYHSKPWGIEDTSRQGKIVENFVDDILSNKILHQLPQLLKDIHPNSEIKYVIGNHDRLLNKPSYTMVREKIVDAFDLKRNPEKQFSWVEKSNEYSAILRHGHRYDMFNYFRDYSYSPVGDLIVWSILDLENKMMESIYASETNKFIVALREAEFVEPKQIVSDYLLHIIDEEIDEPTMRSVAKSVISDNLKKFIEEALQEQGRINELVYYFGKFMSETSSLSPLSLYPASFSGLFKSLTKYYLLHVLSRAGKLLSYLSGKDPLVSKARKEEKSYKNIVFGHTHKRGITPLKYERYYINPGSWKHTITLENNKWTSNPIKKSVAVIFPTSSNKQPLLEQF